jgi:pyruvate dehydrogenase E2 component (dihydrolipoamide acetyltransferase)
MSLSSRNVPRAALTLSVDAAEILKWKKDAKEDGLKIGITEIIIKALGKALRMHPMMNSRLEDEEIVISRDVNVGVALDSEKGLLVPVIRRVTGKGVGEIAAELRSLAAAGKAGILGPEGMTGGTFTLTNLGMIGIEEFTPLVNYPECGILAVGAVKKEMVVNQDDESCSVRPMFRMTIVFDHRIIDGAPAGRFLADLKRLLEHPLSLLQ